MYSTYTYKSSKYNPLYTLSTYTCPHTTLSPHPHTHTHLGAVPHCVGGTTQQMGMWTSVLEEMVEEEPILVEGELSQEETLCDPPA